MRRLNEEQRLILTQSLFDRLSVDDQKKICLMKRNNMKHFTISEFDSPDEPGSGSKMDPDFLELLDMARELSGVPYKINSGYRTKKHNQDINGSQTSSHLKGLAVDIACKNSRNRYDIIYGLLGYFTRIGIAETFIHVDNDYSKPDAIWLY